MKFLASVIAYLAIAFVLGWAILLASVHHNFWLLGAAGLVYVIAFARLGCLPPGKSH